MNKLSFILTIHNHQPVGNFDSLFEKAYQKSYLPFLKILEKHSDIKVVLHFSGVLLSWLKCNHPDFLESLRGFVHEGRVEVLSGGFYEPLLSAIPEEDRIGQIRKLNEFINNEFGYTPRGMWLAERVWEPDLPKSISLAGLEYLPVDDYLFKLSGLDDRELRGYFITEAEGYTVKVFPGNERLRYLIPFKGVEEVISYLKRVYEESNSLMITLADDGEKFGVWPGTYEHVYQNGWLDRFFDALVENTDWLEVTTYAEYLSNTFPSGMVYLPTGSYREMGKWALPPGTSEKYEQVFQTLKKLHDDEKAQYFLRGGFWKNFFTKYPESNHIHKRMLQISKKVHEAINSREVVNREIEDKMLDELWQAQCNDAYWHGLFGGLYLPHLRASLYDHLLKTERLLERATSPGPYIIKEDLDKDGYTDLFISTEVLSIFFTERGGNLCELSYKEKAVNIADILSRRYEVYHGEIENSEFIFDLYRKLSLIDHFLPEDTTLNSFSKGDYKELWDQMDKPYTMFAKEENKYFTIEFCKEGKVLDTETFLKKKILIDKEAPVIKIIYDLTPPKGTFFCTEFNLSFCGSPESLILINPSGEGQDFSGRHGMGCSVNSISRWRGVRAFSMRNKYFDMSVLFKFDEEIGLWHFPIETVSLSEKGLERVYQGTTFIFIPSLHKRSFNFSIIFEKER